LARLSADTLLRTATMATLGGALLVWWDPGMGLGLLGLVGLGFALAPIYPTLIVETPRRLGQSDAPSVIGLQVGAAYLGTAAVPGFTGLLATRAGLEVIGPCLAATAAALLLLYELARRRAAASNRAPAFPAT
jgi:predicted MFS family arabinose efflux permease